MIIKIAAIALLFAGETLTIIAELIASKHIEEIRAGQYGMLLAMLALGIVGVCMLILSYVFGYSSLKNIWIVTAISIGSIIIVEPILAWLLFHQVPTLGSTIGLVLGILGILSALFF